MHASAREARVMDRSLVNLEAARGGGAVDAFQASGAIERVQSAAGPEGAGAQDGFDVLLEGFVVESRDARKPKRGAIAVAAILERTDQRSVAYHDTAGGPRA